MKKLLSVMLTLLLLISCIPLGAVAAASYGAVYGTVDKSAVERGDTFTMSVNMANNPGLVCWLIDVDFDSAALELVSQTKGDAFSGIGSFSFGPMKAGYTNALWYDFLAMENYTNNGQLFSLTFRVKEDAPAGDYPITLYCSDWDNMCNIDFERANFNFTSASVTVTAPACEHVYDNEYDADCNVCGAVREVDTTMLGDTNGDGKVNVRDLGLLQQYLNHWWDITSVDGNGDVVADDHISVRDLGLLQQYLNGWDVKLGADMGNDYTASSAYVYGMTDKNTLVAGQEFLYTVIIRDNPGLAGWHITVDFDTSVLELLQISGGDAFPQSGLSYGPMTSPTGVTYADFINDDVTATGTLFSMRFRVKSDVAPGEYFINLSTPYRDNFSTQDYKITSLFFETKNITVAGHQYVGVVTKAPTCGAAGVMTYTCSACGDAYTVAIPATGAHTYSSATDTTCNECGAVREVNVSATIYGGLSTDSVEIGETFALNVYIKNNPGLVGWNVTVDFDETAFELVSQYTGDAFPASGISYGPLKSPAKATFVDAINPDVTNNGWMYTLEFKVKNTAAAGAHTFILGTLNNDADNFFNIMWETVPVSFEDATVTVEIPEHVHTYDGVCDAYCNTCGEYRTAAAHLYDNACDAYCNVCDAYRTPADHVYSHAYDTACNECGATRVVGHTPPVDIPEVGVPYKFGMVQVNVDANAIYYLRGGMSGVYYLATNSSYASAIDVYLEQADGGYYCYAMVDGSKLYINMHLNASGSHVDAAYESDPSTVYTYDVEKQTIIANVNGADYWIGTRNDKNYTTVGPVKVEYEGFYCRFYPSNTSVCTHTYDNACDAYCNLCGEYRTPAAHAYDNACDVYCNVCGAYRSITHVYDNACDAYCNVCGGYRTPAAHKYSNSADTTCNVCGAIREVNGDFTIYGEMSGEVIRGETVTLNVYMKNNPGLIGWNVQVHFDESAFTLTKFIYGTAFPSSAMSSGPLKTPASVTFADFLADSDYTTDGLLFSLVFTVKDTAALGEYTFTLGTKNDDMDNFTNLNWDSFLVDFENVSTTVVAHTHSYDSVITTAPTCAIAGVKTYTCSGCGDTYTEAIPATGAHEYFYSCDAWCMVCGEYTNPDAAHTVLHVEAVEPTCVVNGCVEYWYCEICGTCWTDAALTTITNAKNVVIPATGAHTYSAVITVAPTCGAPGVMTCTCSVCGDSYTMSIAATGAHTYDNACDAECNVCGGIREVEPHVYEGTVTAPDCVNDGYTTYVCSVCGDTYVDDIVAAPGHAYDSVVTLAPTCGATGVMTHTCSACGDTYTEVIAATGKHTYDHACDTDCNVCGGVREVPGHVYVNSLTCQNCGHTLDANSDAIVQGSVDLSEAAPGDTFTLTVNMANNPGLSGWLVGIDYDIQALEMIEQTAGNVFNPIAFGPKDTLPTRASWYDFLSGDTTANGWMFSITFRVKEGVTTGDTVIKLYSTDPDNFTTVDEQTVYFDFVSAGITLLDHHHTYDHGCDADCNICGAIREVLAHNYESAVTTAPTCVAEGVMTYTCSVCGDTYTESIAPTDEHTYEHPCSVACSVCGGANPAPAEHTYNHVYDTDCDLCGAVREVKMILGDANGDGKVNIRDVGILQQYMNGWNVEFPLEVADVNGDGRVNIRDLGLYQQYMNGGLVDSPIGQPM